MNLNTVINEAITKGAAKTVRKPVAGLRRDVAMLKREVAELKRLVRGLKNDAQRGVKRDPAPEVETSKLACIRHTGPIVRRLRQRLRLTQVEMAKLVGVSGLTISKWETAAGRITLRMCTLEALAKVKGMRKLDAAAALAAG